MHSKELPEKNAGRRRVPNPPRQVAAVARPATGALSPQTVAALQRTAGNAAVARMIERHEEHGGREEHRHSAGCGQDHGAVQRRAADEVGSVVQSAGSRLAPSLQQEMEARFEGEDFSDVTVHTGTAARRSAEAVGAEAYTTEVSHIVFRSSIDKKTLAHELEHVRQQRAGTVAGTNDGSGLRISDPSDRFERSAERKAEQVMRGGVDVQRSAAENAAGAAHRTAGPSAAVQRMPKKRPTRKTTEGQPSTEPPAAEKSEFEKIVEYFEGLSEEFKKKKQNEKEYILERIGVEDGSDLFTLDDVVDNDDMLSDFSMEMETAQHASGFGGTGGGKSDWAASAVTSAHAEMRKDHPHWGDDTTLHHKISRSELDGVLAQAEKDKANAKPLFEFLDGIRAVLGSTAADKKALHNMPSNLEMGPSSDTRRGDPGSGTDFNYVPSGAMTPRSSELKDALALANRAPVDWEAVAEKLREAQRLHEKEYGGAILSPPVLERWEKIGAKWKKASD